MMDKLDKHPSWFKLKVERRELVKQLAPGNRSQCSTCMF